MIDKMVHFNKMWIIRYCKIWFWSSEHSNTCCWNYTCKYPLSCIYAIAKCCLKFRDCLFFHFINCDQCKKMFLWYHCHSYDKIISDVAIWIFTVKINQFKIFTKTADYYATEMGQNASLFWSLIFHLLEIYFLKTFYTIRFTSTTTTNIIDIEFFNELVHSLAVSRVPFINQIAPHLNIL